MTVDEHMFKSIPLRRTGDAIDAPHLLSTLVRTMVGDGCKSVADLADRIGSLYSDIPKKHRHGAAITIYQPGHQRIRVVRRRKEFENNIFDALQAARNHPRFCEFDLLYKARIQFDFFGFVERDIRFGDFSSKFPSNSGFEFGIDGLRIKTDAKDHYFLPGDCYVRSILGLGQLKRYLTRLTGALRIEDCPMDLIQSTSFVSFGDRWLPLYRGHPVPGPVTIGDVEQVCERAINNISMNFRSDERFMYYYDAAKNSHIDHEHPNRDPVKDPYYNELRHCGGIVTLLLAYERRSDPVILSIIEQAIAFIYKISHTYQVKDGRVARYLVYNRKSKLGGAGLALYSLALYQKVTGSNTHARIAEELSNHLLSEILINGEFRYYHIYLDKNVSLYENAQYFSFYYPGEALIGLATYLKWVDASEHRLTEVEGKVKAALQFLLVDRPRERSSEYKSLPSDAWLMAAINEFWDIPRFQEVSYAQFVFRDADRIISQMYTEADALFPDYVGAFYYNIGDFPYPDGARCEGLVAALALAEKLELDENVRRYASALIKTIRATILLANTPESLYFAPDPEKALGGIRFKLTRQWFRIDTIQHVVCYYYRFLDIYDRLMKKGAKLDDTFLTG